MGGRGKTRVYSRVTPHTRPCDVCGIVIDEWNYLLVVYLPDSRVAKFVHDNDGICLEHLLVPLGLVRRTIKSSLSSVGYDWR